MSYPIHSAHAPDISRVLDMLRIHRVRYVLVGSVAAHMYSIAVRPRDLDIVPALDHANLQCLGALLQAIEATPDGHIGQWEIEPGGERRWVEVPLTVVERAAYITSWAPQADDSTTIDHRFHTRYGDVDVVPTLAGTYTMLMQRALCMQVEQHAIWVAHVDDLLATLTIPRYKKDSVRVHALRALQRSRDISA